MTTESPTRDETASEDVLDNLAWESLAGPHARFARTHGAARRYDPDVSVFAGIADLSAESWADLAHLLGPGGETAFSRPGAWAAPTGWEVLTSGEGVQMVDVGVDAVLDEEAVVLGAADVPEVLALIERTRPGPFRPRTIEMGTYLGIRREGRLVAMAGQRYHPPGWTEISAVCTDEAFRRQGLSTRLVKAVAYDIRSRGERPLLHAAGTNTDAIRLYGSLGFEVRTWTTFARLRAPRQPLTAPTGRP